MRWPELSDLSYRILQDGSVDRESGGERGRHDEDCPDVRRDSQAALMRIDGRSTGGWLTPNASREPLPKSSQPARGVERVVIGPPTLPLLSTTGVGLRG